MSSFGKILRQHREARGLTRDELAERSRISARAIAELELDKTRRPHTHTIDKLADALGLTPDEREQFATAARQAAAATGVLAGPPRDGDPLAWLAFIVAVLDSRGVAEASAAAAQWRDRARADPAWVSWAERLITLTADGRIVPTVPRPLPADDAGVFAGRQREAADLGGFLDRVERGRGGLLLVLGPGGIGKSRLITRVLVGRPGGSHAEWITFSRGESGYLGYRRLLAPLWISVRRTEVAPARLLKHAPVLDDILLASGGELTTRHFQGDIAAAVATLLAHEALRRPLMLILDDAHHGRVDSDRLLLDVAWRVNACRVGLIAALRPDELDRDSPLRGPSDQGAGRVAADVVTLIQVPPLDVLAATELLSQRIPVPPPPEVVSEIVLLTEGRPQLIDNVELRVPAAGASWKVKLGAQGLRVLVETIDSRSEAARDILQAAAVCADRGGVDSELVAAVSGQPGGLVEQVLDQERRLGSILAAAGSSYRFRHENWADALISSCPADRLRSLHANCFALLRIDPAADPRRLVRHANEAGASHIGRTELATLASQAADLDASAYAFSTAAHMYEIAVQHTAGAQQVDFMIEQSDMLRFCGRWQKARDVLQDAILLAGRLGLAEREASALIHLERLTWSYGISAQEVTQHLRDVMSRLPPSAEELRAQLQATLAIRLVVMPRQYDNEQADLARSALECLPSIVGRLARADMLLGIHAGLQDDASPDELLRYARQMLDLGWETHSVYHIEEALAACIIDLIRAGNFTELPSALRAHRDFTERSATPTALYTDTLIDAMLALARGDFGEAESGTGRAGQLSGDWGASYAREALMGQAGWLLYETGRTAEVAELLTSLPEQDVSGLNQEVWEFATALIHAENGEPDRAVRILRDVCSASDDLSGLRHGPSRIAILATAAMVLGHPAVCDALPANETRRLGNSFARLLADHPDTFVLAGWPAVLLGSKHRYIGNSYLAAGEPDTAAEHLARAVQDNCDFAILQARAQFDLARALIRMPDSHARGLAELELVKRRAEHLGMPKLALQSAAERERRPTAGPPGLHPVPDS